MKLQALTFLLGLVAHRAHAATYLGCFPASSFPAPRPGLLLSDLAKCEASCAESKLPLVGMVSSKHDAASTVRRVALASGAAPRRHASLYARATWHDAYDISSPIDCRQRLRLQRVPSTGRPHRGRALLQRRQVERRHLLPLRW
jgi:hypothetical protein